MARHIAARAPAGLNVGAAGPRDSWHTDAMGIAGIGRIIFWSGGSLWIGQALGPSEMHAHHAVQLAIALSDRVEFRTDNAAPWQAYAGAVIPPDLPHTFQAPGRMIAHLFCAPESALGRGLIGRFGAGGIVGVPPAEIAPLAAGLRRKFDAGDPDEELEAAALEVLYALSGTAPAGAVDPRILRASAFIDRLLAEPLDLESVARHVGLSAGRFRHLFVAETGISFRAYLLWTRLNRALELGYAGTSWTDAAHAANFADAAHLSRTARRTYGFAPSSMRQVSPGVARMAG
ncbi:MAG: AraC family transcriptional regulator [Mesorhizobium sp.]|nr:MAG: AraC family transcriptional regulator [Mesorhizobium sp.]